MGAKAIPQSVTVEWTVTGALDGTTPAPEVNIDQNSEDPTPFDQNSQIYRPDPVENLGLIDPSLLVGGSLGTRCVPFVTLIAPGAVGEPDASLDLVAVGPEGESDVVFQQQVRDLAGVAAPVFVGDGFNVPQGSDMRLQGYVAGADPIRVRATFLVPQSCADVAAFRPQPGTGPTPPVCDNVLVVKSIADLPAPVAGVIQLPDNTLVKPCGIVDLQGNVLNYGTTTVIQGESAWLDGFRTAAPGKALVNGLGVQFFASAVTLTNVGGDGVAYDGAGGGGGGGVFILNNLFVLGCLRAGTVKDTPFTALQNVRVGGCETGFEYDGDVAFITSVTSIFTEPAAPGHAAIRVLPTATVFSVNITDTIFFLDGVGDVGLDLDPAAGYVAGNLVSNNTFLGPGTPLAGVTKGTPGFRFLANIGILDSANIGNMAFTGNLAGVTTTFPGVGAYVRVGNGNPGTHPLFVVNPSNERFTLLPAVGPTAPTQELRYDGLVPAETCIRAGISVQNPALTAQGFSVRLLQNGVPIPNATLEGQTGGLVTSAGSVMVEGVVTAAPGDIFTLELANLTSTAALVVSSCTFTVGAG